LAKILLHIGLPKTATTSLQVNLFKALHDEEKVNFLGRYMTVDNAEYYNPFGEFYLKFANDDNYKENIAEYRKLFYKLLDKKKINIISEEVLSLTHNIDFSFLLEKIELLLRECEVNILISLRSPVDFLFSYYVELYRWQFYKDNKLNTFDKFIEKLLADSESTDFDILFFERFLFKIENKFPNINVLLFEDINNDTKFYCKQLSDILVLSEDEIESKLFKSKHNQRTKTEIGKFSEYVPVEQIFLSILDKNNRLKYFLKKIPGKALIYKQVMKFLSKIIRTKPIMHLYPSNNEQVKLHKLLSIKDLSFAKKYNLSSQKLKDYNYLDNNLIKTSHAGFLSDKK